MTKLSSLFRASPGITWQVVTSDVTATSGNGYILDVPFSDATVTLPSDPSEGDMVGVIDGNANSDNYTLKIARNGDKIQGDVEDLILDTKRSGYVLVYANNSQGWVIMSSFSGSDSYESGGYNIENSCMFDSSNSDYMHRTPSTTGNRRIWTFSTWVKRGKLGAAQQIFTAGSSPGTNDLTEIGIHSTDAFRFYYYTGSVQGDLRTSMLFRDVGAWYHILTAVDTTQSTASNRVKIYVNGIQITSFSTATYPSQNSDMHINTSSYEHRIGQYIGNGQGYFFDGYLAETIFIDGQALTPSSFGQFDSNGIWQPKGYGGSFGTNGFKLGYADSSDLGKDISGNSNNYTTSGLTTSSQYDDTPTNNYCVLSSLTPSSATSGALSKGNLTCNFSVTSDRGGFFSTMSIASKTYFEVKAGGTYLGAGVHRPDVNIDKTSQVFSLSNTWGFSNNGNQYYEDGARVDTLGLTWGTNDVLMIAIDPVNGSIWYGVNGTWGTKNGNVGNPATGAYPHSTGLPNEVLVHVGDDSNTTSSDATCNFGQRSFTYTAPTGFKALCTPNLPAQSIIKPSDYFDIDLYTGTGSTLSRSALDFQPDLVWFKNRDSATSHQLYDSQRTATKAMYSNAASAEATLTDGLTSFNTNGFTVGSQSGVNGSGDKIVAWCWKEGLTPGFDIVSYTGTGSNRTVSHNLGVVPEMMVVKNRSNEADWAVYHKDMTSAGYVLWLNLTNAETSNSAVWNSTAPTSSVFSVGTSTGTNSNGHNFIAYLFAGVEGFSRFGKYTGNGAEDGPFVWCGFRPAYVLYKNISNIGYWEILDSARDNFNKSVHRVLAEESTAETTTDGIDILSNGFKLRSTGASRNASGDTYIFAAFAEAPFKYARAR